MPAPNRARRAFLTTLGAAVAGMPLLASAADAAGPRYAVLSLIGDKITLVWHNPTTGSHLDTNERHEVPTNDGQLDNTALLAADAALRRLHSDATPVLLSSHDPQLFALQEQMLDKPPEAGEGMAPLKSLLKNSGASRLILLTKYRGEANLRMRNELVGSGMLTGLGFYIDEQMRVRDGQSGATDRGFIAPFAYVAGTLIDADSLAPIRHSVAPETFTVATAHTASAIRPWEAMTAEQKTDALRRLTRRAVAHVVPELLNGE